MYIYIDGQWMSRCVVARLSKVIVAPHGSGDWNHRRIKRKSLDRKGWMSEHHYIVLALSPSGSNALPYAVGRLYDGCILMKIHYAQNILPPSVGNTTGLRMNVHVTKDRLGSFSNLRPGQSQWAAKLQLHLWQQIRFWIRTRVMNCLP